MELVDVLMKSLICSSAGLYRLASDSWRRLAAGAAGSDGAAYEYALDEHIELALELLVFLAELLYRVASA